MTTFTAQIAAFAEKAQRKAELVLKQSAQDVFEIAQTPKAQGGNMPVDTGTLRNSFQSGLNGTALTTGPDAYVMTIAGMELGDVLFGGWGGGEASYARYVEYGTSKMAGSFFALRAAQQWQQIVQRNAEKARNL